MHLDWMMLANYAEAPPGSGLVNMLGAGWDTIHVKGPVEDGPPGVVAVIQGVLALRLVFHVTETGRERKLRISITDEDGGEVGKIEGEIRAEKQVGLPPSWGQGANMVFPLTGLGLAKFGLYSVSLLVDEQHLGDRAFRVIKEF